MREFECFANMCWKRLLNCRKMARSETSFSVRRATSKLRILRDDICWLNSKAETDKEEARVIELEELYSEVESILVYYHF